MTQPWPLDAWPATLTRVLVGRDDRLFPEAFQRRVAEERLGIEAETVPGGHLVPLADPEGVADRLDRIPHRRFARLALDRIDGVSVASRSR